MEDLFQKWPTKPDGTRQIGILWAYLTDKDQSDQELEKSDKIHDFIREEYGELANIKFLTPPLPDSIDDQNKRICSVGLLPICRVLCQFDPIHDRTLGRVDILIQTEV